MILFHVLVVTAFGLFMLLPWIMYYLGQDKAKEKARQTYAILVSFLLLNLTFLIWMYQRGERFFWESWK